jgi:hypothetical protein
MVGSLTRSNRSASLSTPEIEVENYFVEECNSIQDDDYSSITTTDSTGPADDPVTNLTEDFQARIIEDVDFDLRHFYKQEMADVRKNKSWVFSHCLFLRDSLNQIHATTAQKR